MRLLVQACGNGKLDEVKRLLHDVDVERSTFFDRAELGWAMRAAAIKGHVDVTECLLKNGADPNFMDGMVLVQACRNGFLEVVELLLDYGAEPNSNDGQSLRWACAAGHLPIVERLLPELWLEGHTYAFDWSLQRASLHGYTDIVRTLLEDGRANVHGDGNRALQWACRRGHVPCIELLLDHGANVHDRGDQALGLAIVYGHVPAVNTLLHRGAGSDPRSLDVALGIARECRHVEVVGLLGRHIARRALEDFTLSHALRSATRQALEPNEAIAVSDVVRLIESFVLGS